jgi:hypothetical protein
MPLAHTYLEFFSEQQHQMISPTHLQQKHEQSTINNQQSTTSLHSQQQLLPSRKVEVTFIAKEVEGLLLDQFAVGGGILKMPLLSLICHPKILSLPFRESSYREIHH